MIAAQREMMLLNKGYGFVDGRRGFVNTTETLFNIGSMTKQFTASVLNAYHNLSSYPDESNAPLGHCPGPLLGHLS